MPSRRRSFALARTGAATLVPTFATAPGRSPSPHALCPSHSSQANVEDEPQQLEEFAYEAYEFDSNVLVGGDGVELALGRMLIELPVPVLARGINEAANELALVIGEPRQINGRAKGPLELPGRI